MLNCGAPSYFRRGRGGNYFLAEYETSETLMCFWRLYFPSNGTTLCKSIAPMRSAM